jgi:hypothetical protein
MKASTSAVTLCFCLPETFAWSISSLPDKTKRNPVPPIHWLGPFGTNQNQNDVESSTQELPQSTLAFHQQQQQGFSAPKGLASFISTSLLVMAIGLGLLADQAWASADETLLMELSKEDSLLVQSRSPPEIQSDSSERSMALAGKLKTIHAKMYGAYWYVLCGSRWQCFVWFGGDPSTKL